MFCNFCEQFENSKWPPFLARQNFFENWHGYSAEIPCGSNISSKSLYLARFSRCKHFYVLQFLQKIRKFKMAAIFWKKTFLVMWHLWLVEMSLQHIQKNSPRLLPKPAKFEKNPPNGYRVIRKTKCRAGRAWRSPIHKQASRYMWYTLLSIFKYICCIIHANKTREWSMAAHPPIALFMVALEKTCIETQWV